MKRIGRVVIGLALALAFFTPAQAANRARTFTLTPLAGGYLFEGQQNVDRNAPTLGVALGYNLDQTLGAEADFQFINASTDQGTKKDVHGYLYRLDGLYHFRPGKMLVPYLAAGVGALTLNPYLRDAETNGLLDWGGGIKVYGGDNLALRLDVRHLLVFDHPENNLVYTAGLMYQFGGAQPALPVLAAVRPADSDGDGVTDDQDKCPGTPAGARVDKDGCRLDSDGDGVFDEQDKCPNTPPGELVDAAGCTLKLTLHINFDFDKSDIKPEFREDLDRAAAFIRANAAVPYIVIGGHTDSVGDAAYNQQLSERRANAVRKTLITDYGLNPDRLVARGYGETQPIAPNDTDAGRYQNRRVEIVCCAVLPK